MVGFLASMGFKWGETSRNITLPVSPENETLRGKLVVIEKTLFLDGTVGIGDVLRVEICYGGVKNAAKYGLKCPYTRRGRSPGQGPRFPTDQAQEGAEKANALSGSHPTYP